MILSIDTETGGLTRDTSLLTVGLVFYDDDFNLLEERHVKLIPDDGIYRVEPRAMEINKIDLVELAKEAITYKEAKSLIYNILCKQSQEGTDKIMVIGKNVSFDLERIWDNLLSKNSWEKFCSYHTIDISSVFKTMQMLGIFEKNMSGSLESLAKRYKMVTLGLHDALYDAKITAEVYQNMLREIVWVSQPLYSEEI